MSKLIVGLSTSVDGIASGVSEQDAMAVHEAVLGWVFKLRGWQEPQGMSGGEDSAESTMYEEQYNRIGAQIVGRHMYDYSHPYWGENRLLTYPWVT
jgi:hypothetical protein